MFKVNEYFDGTVKSIAFGMAVPLGYLSSNKKPATGAGFYAPRLRLSGIHTGRQYQLPP